MLIEVKQIGGGGSEVSFGQGEVPKYRALREAINGFFTDLLRPLEQLQQTAFTMLALPNTKQEETRFRYTARMRAVLDEALDLFLSEIAGPDRSRQGFVNGDPEGDTPDGVLQQRELFSYAVGLRRGADLVDAAQTLSAGRQSPAVRAMLDNAFQRLSEGGRLRLEKVRDEIHSVLVSATDAGLSPLETGRQLAGKFTEYNRVQFDRLARTEAAYAAEEGNRNQMRDLGVTHVKWLLSSGACPVCESFEGRIFEIDDAENHPPGASHPNCVCSLSPVTAEDLFR